MGENKISIVVIVNGQQVSVEIALNAALQALVQQALQESGNSGQPPENWELRDAAGNVLDSHKKLADYGLGAGASLFLNLKAGVGGSRAGR